MQTIDTSPQTNQADHAQLLQSLSALMAQLNALQTLVRDYGGDGQGQGHSDAPMLTIADMAALRNGLDLLDHMARDMFYELYTTGDALFLEALPDMPLSEALTRLVDDSAEALHLSSRVIFSGEERLLSSEIERLLYRVARDTLSQVQQHSGARKMRFVLSYRRNDLQMSIEDDGVPAEQAPLSIFGGDTPSLPPPLSTLESASSITIAGASLLTLRHRIEHLGGTLEISASVEQGTQVHVTMPYAHHAQEIEQKATQASPPHINNGQQRATQASPPHINPAPAPTGDIRILIVDNQAVTRAGLRRLLESYPDLRVVGEAADGVQAVSETAELGPQVVILDAQLPQGQSLEALRQVKQLNPDTHVLLLSALDREDYLFETLRAGAEGYVLKNIAPDDLAQAVRTVARGEVLLQPQIAGRLISRLGGQGYKGYNRSILETLTAREVEVLRLLAQGLRNKEMAARLVVSERTVNFHLANIYQKLNVSGRTEALSKVHALELLRE